MKVGGPQRWRLVALIGATAVATIGLTVGALSLVPSNSTAETSTAVISAQVTPAAGLSVYDCPGGTEFTKLPPGVIVHWLGNQSGPSETPAGWALVDYNASGTPVLASPPTILPFDAFHAHVTGWVQATGLRLSATSGRVVDSSLPEKAIAKCEDGSGKAIAPPSPPASTLAPAVLGNFLTPTTTTTIEPPSVASTDAASTAASGGNSTTRGVFRPPFTLPPSSSQGPPPTLPPDVPTTTVPPRPLTVPTTAPPTTTTLPGSSSSGGSTTRPTSPSNSTTTTTGDTTTTGPVTAAFTVQNLRASPPHIFTAQCAGTKTSRISVELTGGVGPYQALLTYSVKDQLVQEQLVNPAGTGAGTWYADIPANAAIRRNVIGRNATVAIVVQIKAVDANNTPSGLIDAGLLTLQSC